MNLLDLIMSMVVSVMLATGVYFMMAVNIQRVVIGFLFLSNGVNLGVVAVIGLPEKPVPAIIDELSSANYTDPLPQAFLLTAIVIGLAMASFLLALALYAAKTPSQADLGQNKKKRGRR